MYAFDTLCIKIHFPFSHIHTRFSSEIKKSKKRELNANRKKVLYAIYKYVVKIKIKMLP